MVVKKNPEIIYENPDNDWEALGIYFSKAIKEVAFELDGQELAARVGLPGDANDSLPGLDALLILEDISPGSIERVMLRMEALQQKTTFEG